jgi:Na+/H+-dicarboxylate symporter
MRKLALHWKIMIGLLVGLLVGLALNFAAPTIREATESSELLAAFVGFSARLNEFVGALFVRGLRFIAVPIVLFSLIAGVSSVRDLGKLSRMGSKTVGIYIATTAVAISLGLIIVNIVQPGRGLPTEVRDALGAENAQAAAARIERAQAPDVWDTLLDIVPTNPFEALAEGKMLQIVFLALVIGSVLALLPRERGGPIIDLAQGLSDAFIRLVHIILALAPYAVFALMAQVVATLGLDVLEKLILYSLVVIVGLLVLIFGFYPLVLRLLTPVSYMRFFRAIAPAQLLAFSSSSSSATLPVTMECAEDRLGVSEQVTGFVLPLGATINMDGTALYQGVAAVFIAQIYSMDLDLSQQLTIVLTATLASIGTAGVPGVGLIMLVIVLEAVGIPLEGIAVILGVDRILDMCRTAANVTGDCMVACIVAQSEGELASPEQGPAQAA